MSINVICMDRFIRGVGSKRGQGDQDGVEVPRRIHDGERKKHTSVYLQLIEEGGRKRKHRPTRGLHSPILQEENQRTIDPVVDPSMTYICPGQHKVNPYPYIPKNLILRTQAYVFFLPHHYYFPAQLVGCFTLSDLLDKPW